MPAETVLDKQQASADVDIEMDANSGSASLLRFNTLIGDLVALHAQYCDETTTACARAPFVAKFDELLSEIATCKRNAHANFLHAFQTTNVHIIQLYELAAKLLSGATNTTIVTKCVEMLHVLTTNQHECNEDDECTLACCAQLTHSYNFTSALARILLLQLQYKATGSGGGVASNTEHLLDANGFYLAFSVLNKLTAENSLFCVDIYVKQLIYYAMDKIQGDDAIYIQFLSNILRNRASLPDIEHVFKLNNNYKTFCRELFANVKEVNNRNVVLHSLILIVSLCYDNMFTAPWLLGNVTNGSVRGKQVAAELHSASTKICDSIDVAMRVLTQSVSTDSVSSKYSAALNALNFLIEFFKRAEVKDTLENNDDYSNVMLFKLNQLLVDNHLSDDAMVNVVDGTDTAPFKLPTSFLMKIFRIFTELCTNSSKLALKLFHIVFATRQFVDQRSEDSSSAHQANKLTRKLHNLMLSSHGRRTGTIASRTMSPGGGNVDDHINVIFAFYMRLAKGVAYNEVSSMPTTGTLKANKSKTAAATVSFGGAPATLNHVISLTYMQYLAALFKRMDGWARDKWAHSVQCEAQIGQLVGVLLENVHALHAVHVNDKQTAKLDDDDTWAASLSFAMLSVIDNALQQFPGAAPSLGARIDLAAKLLDAAKQSCCLVAASISESSCSGAHVGSILMSSKLLLRLVLETSGEATAASKPSVLAFCKSDNFFKVLAQVIVHSETREYVELAYAILFNLNELARIDGHSANKFDLKSFVSINLIAKQARTGSRVGSAADLSSATTPISSSGGFALPATEPANWQQPTCDSSDLAKMFAFYQYKLDELKQQEKQMLSMLNSYFSANLVCEAEAKTLREQIRAQSQRETTLREELAFSEGKLMQMQSAQADAAAESKRTAEQLKETAANLEQLEKDNEEAIGKLQEKLSVEQSAKKELTVKLKEAASKSSELERQLQQTEAKRKETEQVLADKQTEIDKLSSEHDKVKSILSYVKENYKP